VLNQDDLYEAAHSNQEGAFDAQLFLPLPAVEAPVPLKTVIKRDGRQEPFDKHKIADAIFKAAQSIGGQDRDLAESLASAITIYLSKRLDNQPPTVDQVHDAVERVLIQMSHAKTALAYARYRDRRARIRRLREGDLRALLSEFEEARHEREALGGHPAATLSVRTSADTLASWDREKIVQALVRETGLEQSIAAVVAYEVEQQLQRAQITTLTTSLVRELVDAKLVEHGLGEYRERHRRLGVPLYDAARIVRGAAPETVGRDPAATDRVLARAVKKEYALAQVFSPYVAEAHLRGDFHIHHLELVDRLFSAEETLETVARFGINLPGALRFASPPRNSHTLLAQMVKSDALAQSFFADPLVWHNVNVHFAPFLDGKNDKELQQFAQMLVYEYAYRALAQGDFRPATEIHLHWTIPASLAGREAVGPGGLPMDKPYAAYRRGAQQIAWAVMEIFRQGGVNGQAFPAPVPVVHIGPDFFHTEGHEAFLRHIAEVATRRGNVHFLLDRSPAIPLMPRTILQQITLNLPRLAYQTGKESALLEGLGRLLDLAATAHQEKRDFLEGLATGNGPLALLALPQDQRPGWALDTARCLLAVEGLNECVQVLINAQLHEGDEAAALARRILDHLSRRCRDLAERIGLPLALAQNNDAGVSARFAALDAAAYPKTAATTIKVAENTQVLHYSAGARLADGNGLSPIDLVRLEGGFHDFLEWGAITEVPLPLAEPSQDALADFLKKTYHQTHNQRLIFR